MFYPISFSDYGSDEIQFYLTCPVCRSLNKVVHSWKELREGWNEYQQEVDQYSSTRYLTSSCPSCALPITLHFALRAGGRMGECQADIIAASWNGNTVSTNLASKPPVHLVPDAPDKSPILRPITCASVHWFTGQWWEARVPQGWSLRLHGTYLFESPYGYLSLGVSGSITEMAGYQFVSISPEVEAPEDGSIYRRTRDEVDASFGFDVPITRYELGRLIGYWGGLDKDGLSSGAGVFSYGDFVIYVYLSCAEKNYSYCWEASQKILSSIKFYGPT